MSRRFDNKRLLFILAGLLLILLLTVLIKMPGGKSTLKGNLVEIDTAAVMKIIITPKGGTGKSFEFVRGVDKWTVNQDNIKSTPTKGAVQNLLTEILSIKPQSLAAVGKSKWEEYELTDSLATRVKLVNKKGRDISDIMTGKFTYKQIDNPYGGYGGNNIQGTTYVRLSGDENIYTVDGFLAFSFGGGFNDWRDKSFIACNKDDITRFTFTLPSGSSFNLARKDSLWFAGNQPADSSNTANYLNSVSRIDGQEFKDGFNPGSSPMYQMVIEGNNLLNITVKCYKGEAENEYILNSSLNPEVYFVSKSDDIFEKLFKPINYFM